MWPSKQALCMLAVSHESRGQALPEHPRVLAVRMTPINAEVRTAAAERALGGGPVYGLLSNLKTL